jgi:hypothetical protein
MVDVEVSTVGVTTVIRYDDWELRLDAVSVGEITAENDVVYVEDPICEIYLAYAPLEADGDLVGYGETKDGAQQMLGYEIKRYENGERSMFDTSDREVLSFDRPLDEDDILP